MRDYFKFVNHRGESITFGNGSYLINENDLRDYEWTYNSQYKKVTSFEKNIEKKSIECICYGADARAKANALFEIIEKDVLASTPGTLYVGDYYIKGYFYGAKKTDYTKPNTVTVSLSFVTDSQYWVKETKYIYRENDSSEERGLGYSYDYPYDFLSSLNTENLYNTSFTDQNIRIVVYGAAIDPAVTIGGHLYKVTCELYRNEYLTIDTKAKTIVRTKSDGTTQNLFSKRDIDSYIFQKIVPGENTVSAYPTGLQYDIIVLEERSEPVWI